MNQQPGVSAQSVRLLWVLSGTSQAPACFASIIINQATIKAEGSALAPRPECVKQQRSAEVDVADTSAGLTLSFCATHCQKLVRHHFGDPLLTVHVVK